MLNISQSLCLLDTHALVVLEKVLKSTCAKLGVSENYNNIHYIICTSYIIHRLHITVKLGDKERFDKEQIGVKEAFPVTNCQSTS